MITDLIAHCEQQLHLEAVYHEAKESERAAWQADIDNPYGNHERFYSQCYLRAFWGMREAWWNWRAARESEGTK